MFYEYIGLSMISVHYSLEAIEYNPFDDVSNEHHTATPASVIEEILEVRCKTF